MAYGVQLPGRIGPYTVERELGAGGMGTVYRARSRGGRTVAVKVARPELAGDPHFRARFRAEVEAARKVGGFHTAQVVDADPDADPPWLATAYVPGPTLAGLIDEQGPMGEERLRALGAALAEALQAIHACGLVHRDLKPGNIIMAEDGPRVLDFGIARAVENTRLTSTGAAFGTPGFLAPEQAQGLEVGPAADVFALGAVLVAAAGGSAFGAGTPMGLMYRSVHETADLSAVPVDVREVVAACLTKDPAARPTPERLLDLFVPQVPGQPQSPTHPPTVAATPSPPAPEPRSPEPLAPTADSGITDAGTADAPRRTATRPAGAEASPPAALPAPTPTATRWRRRNMVLSGVLVSGAVIAGMLARGSGDGGGDGKPFPAAEYELTQSATLLDGAYVMPQDKFPTDPEPLDDSAFRKDAFYIDDTWVRGPEAIMFQGVHLVAEYGRFKDPQGSMSDLMRSVVGTNEETTEEPAQKVAVPGSKTEFTCMSASDASYGTVTVCAWADPNTVGVLEFRGMTHLKRAAKETAMIRDELRRPIEDSGS